MAKLKVLFYLECIHPRIVSAQLSSLNNSIGHIICMLYSPLLYICSSWTPISMVSIQEIKCAIYSQPSAGRSTCIEVHANQDKFGK